MQPYSVAFVLPALIAITLAPGAAADPDAPYDCGQVNRCRTVEIDAGPASAGQQVWANCIQTHTVAECDNIVNAGPPPPTRATASFIPGKGSYRVGIDIQPGTYVSRGGIQGNGCNWARLGGDATDVIASGSSTGTQTVTIVGKDGAFETSNCQSWTRA